MATRKDDDSHNPFGPSGPKPSRAPKPGIFDPGFGDDDDEDPFHPTHQDDDEVWDDDDQVPGSHDA